MQDLGIAASNPNPQAFQLLLSRRCCDAALQAKLDKVDRHLLDITAPQCLFLKLLRNQLLHHSHLLVFLLRVQWEHYLALLRGLVVLLNLQIVYLALTRIVRNIIVIDRGKIFDLSRELIPEEFVLTRGDRNYVRYLSVALGMEIGVFAYSILRARLVLTVFFCDLLGEVGLES